MRIGVPTEIKDHEYRVGLVPASVSVLLESGHDVLVQSGAGDGSGFADEEYTAVGARLADSAEQVYADSEMIVKVKEPQPEQLDLYRPDQMVFSYLHLAAEPAVTKRLCEIGMTAVAFETVTEHGPLPLLAPMSDVAGRIAAMTGAQLLSRPLGGKGLL